MTKNQLKARTRNFCKYILTSTQKRLPITLTNGGLNTKEQAQVNQILGIVADMMNEWDQTKHGDI